MEGSTSTTAEDSCPVCMGTITNPSQPSPCCNKVFCQSCLTQSTSFRFHCPHCRTPLPGSRARPQRTALFQSLPGLTDGDSTFSTAQPVGNNIHALLNQLRDGRIQSTQTPNPSTGNPASQASPARGRQANPIPTAIPFLRRHIHRSRVLLLATAHAPLPVPVPASLSAPLPVPVPASLSAPLPVPVPASLPAPLPVPVPASLPAPLPAPAVQPAPLPPAPARAPLFSLASSDSSSDSFDTSSDFSSDGFDEMALCTEIELMEHASERAPGPIVRTFKCPYCQEDGLDDLDLRDHCNENHLSDSRRVVCPVCVSLPHGNPRYHSRDFIGHLNLRHCYYIQDITNIHQSDDVNLQAAILMSLSEPN